MFWTLWDWFKKVQFPLLGIVVSYFAFQIFGFSAILNVAIAVFGVVCAYLSLLQWRGYSLNAIIVLYGWRALLDFGLFLIVLLSAWNIAFIPADRGLLATFTLVVGFLLGLLWQGFRIQDLCISCQRSRADSYCRRCGKPVHSKSCSEPTYRPDAVHRVAGGERLQTTGHVCRACYEAYTRHL